MSKQVTVLKKEIEKFLKASRPVGKSTLFIHDVTMSNLLELAYWSIEKYIVYINCEDENEYFRDQYKLKIFNNESRSNEIIIYSMNIGINEEFETLQNSLSAVEMMREILKKSIEMETKRKIGEHTQYKDFRLNIKKLTPFRNIETDVDIDGNDTLNF